MSADNYLRVVQKGKKYEVRDGNASTGHETVRKTFDSLEKALKCTRKIRQTEIVEYGVSFSLEEETKPIKKRMYFK